MTNTIDSVANVLGSNAAWLNADEKAIVEILIAADQQHLFKDWPNAGVHDEDKKRLLNQAADLNKKYPGGIKQYVENAKALLKSSAEGGNPYEGFTPAVPEGEALYGNTPELDEAEARGMLAIGYTGYVLVAGGLGERLGYNGIKIALPSEITTETSFIELYIKFILAYQSRARESTKNPQLVLPLAIMTSDDTHQKTVDFLEENANFGMKPEQIRILKQEKVPAIIDNDGHIALSSKDAYVIETKPHGHGDVHMLLYQHNVVEDWINTYGTKHIFFFQDTNGAVFRSFPAALGVSVKHEFEVNSLTVARKPGEAVGAICRLNASTTTRSTSDDTGESPPKKNKTDASSLTINVEYNQLEPLLRATISPEGDVPDESGFSPYPGNINALIFAAVPYNTVLQRTRGAVPEFVNPKYKDKTKTTFKAPTRLECMMQDYPRLLTPDAKVGFTQFERWMAFSAVKNNVTDGLAKFKETGFSETASSGESNLYAIGCNLLRLGGKKVDIPARNQSQTFAGIPTSVGPVVVLTPRFGVTQSEIRNKLQSAEIKLSSTSTLVLDAENVQIKRLRVDGALVIKSDEAKIVLEDVSVQNKGWKLHAVEPTNKGIEEKFAIRGYTLERLEQRVIEFDDDNSHVVNDSKTG